MTKGASTLTAEEFAASVEALIADAKAKGLPDETLLVEIEDIASLLREDIDAKGSARPATADPSSQRPDLDRRHTELPWSFRTPVRH